jgi:hypothetical protein
MLVSVHPLATYLSRIDFPAQVKPPAPDGGGEKAQP